MSEIVERFHWNWYAFFGGFNTAITMKSTGMMTLTCNPSRNSLFVQSRSFLSFYHCYCFLRIFGKIEWNSAFHRYKWNSNRKPLFSLFFVFFFERARFLLFFSNILSIAHLETHRVWMSLKEFNWLWNIPICTQWIASSHIE